MGANVFLIFGGDEFVVSAKAEALVKERVPAADAALGLETIDGDANDVTEAVEAVEQCLAALMTRGMFGGNKVVWFRKVNFLTDTAPGRSDAVKARVGRLAELINQGLDPSTTLVISAAGAHKRYALYKACKKQGEVLEFATSRKPHEAERAAAAMLGELASARKLRMSGEARALFLERVGQDSRMLANELDKLDVFLGERREVRTEDVRAIVSRSRESPAWDLADAFGRRELTEALGLTRQLLFQKESPIRLVITVEGRIRDLMLYKEGLQRKWLRPGRGRIAYAWGTLPDAAEEVFANELDRDPRSTHPFRVGLLAEQASRFSRTELRACLAAAVATHEKLVSSAIPETVALETMLVKMLA